MTPRRGDGKRYRAVRDAGGYFDWILTGRGARGDTPATIVEATAGGGCRRGLGDVSRTMAFRRTNERGCDAALGRIWPQGGNGPWTLCPAY